MRDAVAYWIFRTSGVPAPRTTYAEVFFNVPGLYHDTSAGLFTIIEDVNSKFLERVLPKGNGLLMKPEQLGGGIRRLGNTWAEYAVKLRPDRDATPHEQQRVMGFRNCARRATWRSSVRRWAPISTWNSFRFIAVNAFTSNWDSYLAADTISFVTSTRTTTSSGLSRGSGSVDAKRPGRRGGVPCCSTQRRGRQRRLCRHWRNCCGERQYLRDHGTPGPVAPPAVAMPGADILNPAQRESASDLLAARRSAAAAVSRDHPGTVRRDSRSRQPS
jgi:hypothetical protein